MSVSVIRDGARPKLNELFIRYMNVMDRRNVHEWDRIIGGEIEHLLRRLDWLIHQTRLADLEFNYRFVSHDRQFELTLALPTLTDSWYYHAFRTMRLIKNKCPDLDGFEVRNVNLVRNLLIEHPDQKSAGSIYNPNFATGTDEGPEVKGARWDHQLGHQQDFPGVFATAEEFATVLRALLEPYWMEDVQWEVAQRSAAPEQ